MLNVLIVILVMGVLFKLTGLLLGIVGKIFGGLLGLIGYAILGVLAVAVFGFALFAVPIILIVGIVLIIALCRK